MRSPSLSRAIGSAPAVPTAPPPGRPPSLPALGAPSGPRLLWLALASALWLALALVPATPASAAPYAAIVMDMRTGKVVHARSADHRQQPASLTKLMTLYLTFEALENGQLDLDQRVRVSRKASRQVPSKLYLKAGQRVSIRHLIRAAAIKSANDAALVLAEAVGGSEKRFAQMMTAKARQLGMTSTTFQNPHGLTRRGHLSTARDMARLARALYFDFPEYYNVFGRTDSYAAGKRVYTTNRLLHSYSGAEGMKTGYTRAAGFNLVATASRGQRRVIAVVMGADSSRWRNARVAKLLDMGFARTPTIAKERPPVRRGAGLRVATAPVPAPRPATAATGLAALAPAAEAAVPAALTRRAQTTTAVGAAAPSLAVSKSLLAPTTATLPPLHPRRPRGADRRRLARSAGSTVVLSDARPAPAGTWMVQLGAFSRHAYAAETLERIAALKVDGLDRGRAVVQREPGRSGRMFYKARILGLSEAVARNACKSLKTKRKPCLALAPR